LCLIALSGCLAGLDLPTSTPVPPTATATIIPTSTATIIWFPATATFTPAPTRMQSPTPDMRPVKGPVLLEDPFTDKKLWTTGRTGVGSIAYGNGDLTLAVALDHGTLASLRKSPQLDNFYLEIDAQPSLCRSDDAYGLLLRASTTQDFYRLMVTCNGQLRLERVKGGRSVPLQDWVSSGQVFPGGMMRYRLSVWAQGQEMRVFVNDVYQFSAKDPVWNSGAVGVFARSASDTPLTVSFSNMVVYGTGAAQPIAPLKALPSPTSTRKPVATQKP
jgi:hypothetical protein